MKAYTNSEAAAELRKDTCVACGGVKRAYHGLCTLCSAGLLPAMRTKVDAGDGAALTRAVEIAREARLRAMDDHATVGTHCCGGDL